MTKRRRREDDDYPSGGHGFDKGGTGYGTGYYDPDDYYDRHDGDGDGEWP